MPVPTPTVHRQSLSRLSTCPSDLWMRIAPYDSVLSAANDMQQISADSIRIMHALMHVE